MREFIRPLEVKPLEIQPMNVTPMIPVRPVQSNIMPNASGYRKSSCNYDKHQRYKEQNEKLLTPKMESHLRGHSSNVLHGGRSLNRIIAKNDPNNRLYRESLDWDLYSRTPKKTAKKIEKIIDTLAKCDIAQVTHVPVPNITGVEDPTMSSDLYSVETPDIYGDAEVDVMKRPKKLSTSRHQRITHESLQSQYDKALKGQLKPMRSFKSGLDRRRIEKYWRGR